MGMQGDCGCGTPHEKKSKDLSGKTTPDKGQFVKEQGTSKSF